MNDETIIDQNEVKNESNESQNEQNQNVGSESNPIQQPQNEAPAVSKNVGGKGKTVAASVISAAAGVGGTFGGKVVAAKYFPDEPEEGEELDVEDPSLEEGEEEVAETEEVVEDMETEGSEDHLHLTGHDMSIAHGVNDSMSFSEAFAAARHEVGPGGIFEWHGQAYGTYYSNEWDAMSDEEHDQYWADVSHTVSHIDHTPDVPIGDSMADMSGHVDSMSMGTGADADPSLAEAIHYNTDGGETNPLTEPTEDPYYVEDELEPEPLVLDEDEVIAELDLNGDGIADTAVVDANGNEVADVLLDTTGDGSYDMLVVDPITDENGDVYVEEGNVVDVDGLAINTEEPDVLDADVDVDDVLFDDSEVSLDDSGDPSIDDEVFDVDDLPEDDFVASNPDVDNLASIEYDPDVTIDNDMDMGEFV